MSTSVKIIADSTSRNGYRLTTVQLRYPRFIHAELMTHRMFSRNASSSRAIPVERLIKDVEDDPVYPTVWGKNQKGMQAAEIFTDSEEIRLLNARWESAKNQAVYHARGLAKLGVHKQLVNRLLEPFSHINVIVSATEWNNFFALRCHPDAQPEIQVLACAIREAMSESDPEFLDPGDWHLPYISEDEGSLHPIDTLRKLSAARCARVSYLTHDNQKPNRDGDLILFERLASGSPVHASPLEHQATPDNFFGDWEFPQQHGNYVGWRQFRKMIPNNYVEG